MELIFERVDKIHIDFVVRTHGGLVQRSKQLVILGATHQMPTEFSWKAAPTGPNNGTEDAAATEM